MLKSCIVQSTLLHSACIYFVWMIAMGLEGFGMRLEVRMTLEFVRVLCLCLYLLAIKIRCMHLLPDETPCGATLRGKWMRMHGQIMYQNER